MGYFNNGDATSSGDGSFVQGYSSGGVGLLSATQEGASAMGWVSGIVNTVLSAQGQGAHARGMVQDSQSRMLSTGGGASTVGCAANGGLVRSTGLGSFAGGYSRGGIPVDSAIIEAMADGAYAFGEVFRDPTQTGTGILRSTMQGAHAEGSVLRGDTDDVAGDVSQLAIGRGSHVEGYTRSAGFSERRRAAPASNSTHVHTGETHEERADRMTRSIETRAFAGVVKKEASGAGAHAEGYVSGGLMESTSSGSHTQGFVMFRGCMSATDWGAHASGLVYEDGSMQATGRGAHAFGFARDSSFGMNMLASGDGSIAMGYASKALTDASLASGWMAESHLTNMWSHGFETADFGQGSIVGQLSGYIQFGRIGSPGVGPFNIPLPASRPGSDQDWFGTVTVAGKTLDATPEFFMQKFQVVIAHVASPAFWEIVVATPISAPVGTGAIVASSLTWTPTATSVTLTLGDMVNMQRWAVRWDMMQF